MEQSKSKYSFITGLFIKLRLAKNQKGANKAMIVVSAVAILASVFIDIHYIIGYNPFVKKIASDYSNLPPDVQKMLQPAQK